MLSVAILLGAVLISLVVTRMATIWLTATGLPRESARFQARSAFTGVGFTTSEAEQIVTHPVRRRVVMFLMLLGNAGIVAVLGSLILGFANGRAGWDMVSRVGMMLAGLLALWLVSKSAWVDRALSKQVRRLIRRKYGSDISDRAHLLHVAGDWHVSELLVRDGDWMAGHAIGDLKLRDEGVTVLGIVRRGGSYVAWPDGRTPLSPGDVVIVYGRDARLAELDSRRGDRAGERAHEQAARQHDTDRTIASGG